MKTSYLVIAIVFLASCNSKPVRSKNSDKTLRVAIDADSIDQKNHTILQNDLVNSKKFYVVDRSEGLRAIKIEQEKLHREDADRYEDKQKYAQWGKLYGIGSIIVAKMNCADNPSTENILWGIAHLATLGIFHNKRICAQYLQIIDSNTGEVVTSIRNEFKTDSESYQISWEDAVHKLITSYPKYFEESAKDERLVKYEEESEKLANEQKELIKRKAKEEIEEKEKHEAVLEGKQ